MKSNMFIRKIYSKKTLARVDRKITSLGLSSTLNVDLFLTWKLFLLVLIFLTLLFMGNYGYVSAPVITILFYFLYDYYFLDLKVKKRSKILEKDSIFFFSVLALTLQSEKNLKLCLEITTGAIESDLSKEFAYALKEVKLGKSLNEALEDLKTKIPSKSVNNVLLNIIEANLYGHSISDSLNNQIEYLTDKKVLEIKGQINQIPTKISIVSVLLFLPLILLLILAPVLINYFT